MKEGSLVSCSPDALRLFHASDLHFGAEDEAPLDAFKDAVSKEKPDLVILTGDITHNARRVEIRKAYSYLSQIAVPVCLVPGNHDTPVFSPLLRLTDPFGRFYTLSDPQTGLFHGSVNPTKLWSNLALGCLRTAHGVQWRRDWSLGRVMRREQERCSRYLAESPARWKLLACHHPLIDPPSSRVRGQTQGGVQAHTAFTDAGIHLILCGHAHQPFAGVLGPDPKGPVTLVAPTLSNNRTRGHQQGFLDIRLSETGIQVDLRKFNPEINALKWTRQCLWPIVGPPNQSSSKVSFEDQIQDQ